MRLPVLIFDFGNVIAHFDHAIAFEHLARPRGLNGRTIYESAKRSGFVSLLKRFESGQISPEVFVQETQHWLGFDVSFSEFSSAWSAIFWPNESIKPLLKHLASANYQLLLGSNTNRLHADHFCSQFATTLNPFTGRVFSYEIGFLKPAPEFFEACWTLAGVSPNDCLFVDDLLENVEGAQNAGLNGIQYLDTNSLLVDLQTFGIDLSDL